MGWNVKTVVNLWWLQLLKRQNTYVFAEPLVWDREVGGSNPLAPTKHFNKLTAASTGGRSACGEDLWP